MGNLSHHRGAQNDAANDFGDDARLADLGQRPMQDMADDQDERGLDNEDDNGVLGVVLGRIGSLNHTRLRGCSVAIFCGATGSRQQE